ncbi:hypothetical protein [Moraxella lacunata]
MVYHQIIIYLLAHQKAHDIIHGLFKCGFGLNKKFGFGLPP